MIPVIDIFAGPGGLGEGFSAYRDSRNHAFKIALSIEKDRVAHETLKLRSFFRQFAGRVPSTYYEFLRREIRLPELYRRHPDEERLADQEAWRAALGQNKRYPVSEIDSRIYKALAGSKNWVLIGGPPCQAYSLMGRSRMKKNPRKHRRDRRHVLYREYLRILAVHRPPVFVMENVKGILSSRFDKGYIVDRILSDLERPHEALETEAPKNQGRFTYKLFAFADYGEVTSNGRSSKGAKYVIRCERHGIPQARHRFILLGVRSDIKTEPVNLDRSPDDVPMWDAIKDLPPLRSTISRRQDSAERWLAALTKIKDLSFSRDDGFEWDIWETIEKMVERLNEKLTPGGEFVRSNPRPSWRARWYYDPRLRGVCHHAARGHIEKDLWRYFFSACFAATRQKSPVLTDFPLYLLPNHRNVPLEDLEDEETLKFSDRFRVQVMSRPATTITSHIAKDGHYFIHPDPVQCRSLTVREAARLQTFPDNYYFAGPRTEQYKQVGNAVPPLLAKQLAGVVYKLFR